MTLVSIDGRRFVDAAVHVGFGGKMNDGVAAGHGRFDGGSIADIALDEGVLGIVRDRFQIGEISGVGQLVVIDDANSLWRAPGRDG